MPADEFDLAAAMDEAEDLDAIRDAAIAADQSEGEQARRVEAVAALVEEENRAAPSEDEVEQIYAAMSLDADADPGVDDE